MAVRIAKKRVFLNNNKGPIKRSKNNPTYEKKTIKKDVLLNPISPNIYFIGCKSKSQ